MNELDDLGFVYIAEETSPDYTMRGLNVHDKEIGRASCRERV